MGYAQARSARNESRPGRRSGTLHPMVTIALTGGIGAGKSTVARMLRSHGAQVFDVDAAAREVLAPGGPGVAEVAALWPEVVDNGIVDRPALAAIVFSDDDQRAHLNAIVHPRTWERIDRALAEYRLEHPQGVAVVDIPLLSTSDRSDMFDATAVVYANQASRIRRLVEQRGMTEGDALSRMAVQASDAELAAIADVLIDNSGTETDLASRVDELWTYLCERANRQGGAL